MNTFHRSISTPITSSAAFYYEDSQEAEDIFSGNCANPLYSRMGNPTSSVLEQQLSTMENGVGAVATSSGMGAITMVLMSLCSSDDEIVAIGGLFGGTYAFMTQTLPRFGIKTKFLSVDDLDTIESSITTKTKVIFCESVGNPSLRLPDLEAIGKIATKHNIAFIVDNTVTPVIVKPFEYGADIVIYSTTKIISGNSSALGGIAIFKEVKEHDKFHTSRYEFLTPFINKLKGKALIGCSKKRSLRDFGMSANAHSSYQTLLGLETLDLRNNRINTSCEIVAKVLKSEGLNVNHPSLNDNIDKDLYDRNFSEGTGSMITIDMGTQEKAYKFLDASKLLTITANIGDSRTLGLHMGSTIYQDFTSQEKEFLGITDGLIRLSIGLEKPQDIIDDLLNCFEASK
ncbi:aminotransferase class I/II-fold pyridoxal phosphate-dependent enzyme [Arcobacteraceae bacterium]|nr:aminotransferase class I/II-fold pyridoxal phosphate-dependent enzyme [Arcobacteraceae bacterium]